MIFQKLPTVFTLLIALFFTLNSSAHATENQPQNATESSFEILSLLPIPSTYAKSGFGLYRSAACPCFDRQTWSLDMGINLRWHRFISLDAEYHYGTMILGGNFPTSGYALGLRSGLTPEPTKWWNDFYIRGGVGWLSTMGARDSSHTGLYLHPGWAIEIFPILHLETELAASYFFGAMEHINIGFRTGIRFGF